VTENITLQKGVFLIKVKAPEIAARIKPSQFCNLKVSQSVYPLLRRPFSVCDVIDDELQFMIQIQGEGTELLSKKEVGDRIDLIGPLGNGFNLEGDYKTAIIIAGGIGAAPFPYLNKMLKDKKNILSISGGRTKEYVIKYGMDNLLVATDDGSEGFHGNVVQLFEEQVKNFNKEEIKVFSCGPTPMLRSLSKFCLENEIECELSTESAMACGFGICMGCPVDSANGNEYKLICKDGPVFNARDIVL